MEQIAEPKTEKPPLEEGALIKYVLRPTGKKEVRWIGGKETEVALPAEIFTGPTSKRFRKDHFHIVASIDALAREAEAKGRQIALLQDELVSMGLNKHKLKECESMGLVTTCMVELRAGNQNIGGRKAVFLSPQGAALIAQTAAAVEEAARAEAASGASE